MAATVNGANPAAIPPTFAQQPSHAVKITCRHSVQLIFNERGRSTLRRHIPAHPRRDRPTPRPRCCGSRRGRAPAMQRGHTRCTASACRPDSGRMSAQSTCGYRPSRDRLSASPQRDWFVPGAQACTSPPGRRTPSGSTHSLDAATAYLIPPLCTIGPLTSSGHQRHELAPRDSPPSRQLIVLGAGGGVGSALMSCSEVRPLPS